MTNPNSTREALLAEALGEAAKLIQQVEALVPTLDRSRRALVDAHRGLAGQLAAFEAQVADLTGKAKVQAVTHIAARTDEAARRSIDLQAQAMADAARVAFADEVGASLQRLQWSIQRLLERPRPGWEPWLTHAAAAATGSAVTMMVTALLCTH